MLTREHCVCEARLQKIKCKAVGMKVKSIAGSLYIKAWALEL